MTSLRLRDLLAIGAILAGLVVMYFISTKNSSSPLAPAAASSVASSQSQTNPDDSNQQSDKVPFAISAEKDSLAAPDFTLLDTHGNSVKLSDAVKKGPVLLDFWATWCGPCQMELPHLSGVYDEYKSRGVQIYAINTDTDLAGLKTFFRDAHPDCPVLIDPDQSVGNTYSVTALPTLCIIDNQMRIRSRFEGFDPNTEADLDPSLDKLLKGA